MGEGKHTKSRVIRIRNVMYNEQKKALTQFYLKTGPHIHTHTPKRNDGRGLY